MYRILIIMCIAMTTTACSSEGDFCLLGSSNTTGFDYEQVSWESLENKSLKEVKNIAEECKKEAADAEANLVSIFTQLCFNDHISKEYLYDAVLIQNNFLTYYYGERNEQALVGSTEQVLKKYLVGGKKNKPNAEELNKACALFIPKNNTYYDYGIVDTFSYHYYSFQQCMSRNNLEEMIPLKTTTYCKGLF